MSSGTILQASEEMTAELQNAFQMMVQGYARLRHAAVDIQASQPQISILAALMSYAKILTSSILAHIAGFKTIRRSATLSDLGLDSTTLPAQRNTTKQDIPPSEPMPFMGTAMSEEHAFLRTTLRDLGQELCKEIQARGVASAQQERFSAIAGESRRDTEMAYTLREHMRENFLAPLPEMEAKEAIAQLSSLNATVQEHSDRAKADSLKLSADKYALLAEKKVLLEKSKKNEQHIVQLTQANGVLRNAQRPQKRVVKSGQAEKSEKVEKSGTVLVGGVRMEQEVVEWLRGMYDSLSAGGGDVSLKDVKEVAKAPSGFAEFVESKRKGADTDADADPVPDESSVQ